MSETGAPTGDETRGYLFQLVGAGLGAAESASEHPAVAIRRRLYDIAEGWTPEYGDALVEGAILVAGLVVRCGMVDEWRSIALKVTEAGLLNGR